MADLKAQLEISADASGVEAGVSKAKRSIRSLGATATDASKKASDSIDRYVKRLEVQSAVLGKSTREAELYKLSLRGASAEQLRAADSALKLAEGYQKGEIVGQRLRAGMLAVGAAAVTGLLAAAVSFDTLVKKAGDFQDLAEKTGDTAENIASLAVAAGTAGVAMDQVAGFSVKLTKNLTGVDDESKAAGAAIKALGLDLDRFKALKPADQIEALAKALDSFADGPKKTAVMEALAKGASDLLPFLKELGAEGGRQNILSKEQIRLGDEYADRQARLRTEIGLHAQAIATEALPALNDFAATIAELAKDQEFAATAADVLKGSLKAGIVVFQTIAVVATDVGFVFKGLGRDIGAVAAGYAALARLDLKGFRAISDAVKEDEKRARAELDRFQARVMAMGNTAPKFADPRILGPVGTIAQQAAEMGVSTKRELKFDGKGKSGGSSSAGQIAKAQLAADIEDIKLASANLIGIYADAERIMEARRAAGLVNEREYYDAKLGFLRLNSDEQERALRSEIARLEAEKLTGKDAVDNARKIAEAQAKLDKVRQSGAASVEILKIQETSALKAIEQAYRDAEDAARDYLDTLIQAQRRDLAGIGAGSRERERMGGRAQIEDRYTQQRQSLEKSRRDAEFAGTFDDKAKARYDDELDRTRRFQSAALAEYDGYFAERLRKEQDWSVGASEAMANYYAEASNIAKQTEDLFANAFRSMEDALVSFVTTGKLDFKSFADVVAAQITRIIIQQQLAAAIGGKSGGGGDGWLGEIAKAAISSLFGGSGGMTAPGTTDLTSITGRAIGGPVSAGGLYRVNEKGPELLSVAGKQYLMMGGQPGNVTPNAGATSGGDTYPINITVAPPAGTSRSSATQWGSEVARTLQRSLSRTGG